MKRHLKKGDTFRVKHADDHLMQHGVRDGDVGIVTKVGQSSMTVYWWRLKSAGTEWNLFYDGWEIISA